jgi:hypothetical protein
MTSRPPRAPPAAQRATGEEAERVVGIRKTPGGVGQQYEIRWRGQEETTWEAVSRMRRLIPELVRAFEETRQQQSAVDAAAEEGAEGVERGRGEEAGEAVAADGTSMRAQMEAMRQLLREQAQQLQQLRASPAHSPAHSPQPSPQLSPQLQSRFAHKEPRAQDLREYDGAADAKLDEWLQELALAADLYELNARESIKFAASRLRGAALQWWLALSAQEREAVASISSLATALRARFQPVTAARTAREQLDKLQQGSRHINDYIADFQRLHTLLPTMAEEDALYAFERGLRRDLAEKLRVQGVSTLREAIAMAARVGGLLAAQPSAPTARAAAAVHQMEMDDGDEAALEERITRSVLNALQLQGGAMAGLGAKTQTHRGYQQERSGGRDGARGGRWNARGGATGGPARTPRVPGVPAAVVEQRRAAGQCYRCGSADHTRFECVNASSASAHSSN